MTRAAEADPDLPPPPLVNRYWLLRHGHSEANARSIIVSTAARGRCRFGLTQRGRAEVAASLQANLASLAAVTRIYASDFLRTRQTAEIAAAILGVDVVLAVELRERNFGDWEGASTEHYAAVWRADARDPGHRQGNVESVASVAARGMDLIGRIESSSRGETFLLVSHGDPLQILMLAAAGGDLRTHRQLAPLQTAEIRPLGGPPR